MESALYIVPVLVVVVFLSTAIKVLREYERAVIFRLGRLIAAKGPGLVLLIPLVDKMVKVSLRTLAMEVPPQDVITRDNVSVKVSAVVFFRVLDPRNAVVQVQDFLFATPRSPRRPCGACSARSNWTTSWPRATRSTSSSSGSSTSTRVSGG